MPPLKGPALASSSPATRQQGYRQLRFLSFLAEILKPLSAYRRDTAPGGLRITKGTPVHTDFAA